MVSTFKKDKGCFMSEAKKPRFFKIILQETIGDGKLRIPPQFVRKYGNHLSHSVLLKVSTGGKWKVELVRHDGEVWLEKGWKEFAEYYSLFHGSFLVFEYESRNHFNVFIFDTSAVEINYPLSLIFNGDEEMDSDGQFEAPTTEETDDDVSVEIIEDISRCRKSKEKSTLPSCSQPHKTMRTNLTTGPRGNRCMAGREQRRNEVTRRTRPVTSDEKEDVLQRARASFKSKNPFFMVAMQPSYLPPEGGSLNIPYKFSKSNFKEQHGHVVLSVPDGRTWIVEHKFYVGNKKAKFLCSWTPFASDNKLEVGDVCVFELIKGSKLSLAVPIFRVADDASCSSSLTKFRQSVDQTSFGGQVSQGIEFANEFASTLPCFKVVLRLYHLEHCNVAVPFSIVERYVEHKEHTLELQIADRSWPVKLITYSNSKSAKLSRGWAAFSRENSLQVGDVCDFKMINSGVL